MYYKVINMVVEYILKIYEYAASIVCPFALKQNAENDEDEMESQDHFDEYTKLITITDNQIYSHEYNYYNDNDIDNKNINININRFPLKRSQSCNIPHYYCGYCCKIIKSPELMYRDKPYCTSKCRNSQITADNKNKTREHHSFSI